MTFQYSEENYDFTTFDQVIKYCDQKMPYGDLDNVFYQVCKNCDITFIKQVWDYFYAFFPLQMEQENNRLVLKGIVGVCEGPINFSKQKEIIDYLFEKDDFYRREELYAMIRECWWTKNLELIKYAIQLGANDFYECVIGVYEINHLIILKYLFQQGKINFNARYKRLSLLNIVWFVENGIDPKHFQLLPMGNKIYKYSALYKDLTESCLQSLKVVVEDLIPLVVSYSCISTDSLKDITFMLL